jgi:hypothetical protein
VRGRPLGGRIVSELEGDRMRGRKNQKEAAPVSELGGNRMRGRMNQKEAAP